LKKKAGRIATIAFYQATESIHYYLKLFIFLKSKIQNT
jgi:hypothetical protein